MEQKDEKKIIEQLFKERDNYQSANLEQRNTFNDIYSVYIGKMDDVKKVPYKTKESSSKLRTEVAYIVPSIFSGTPEIEVEGVGEEDKPLSKVIEKIINYRILTIPQFYEKIEAWVKQSVTFGTSIAKVVWHFEIEEKTENDENGEESKYMVVVRDEPDVEVPNILDCYYNPVIPNIEDQESLIFRLTMTEEAAQNNKLYDFVGADGKLNREKIQGKGSTTIDQYNSSRQESSDQINSQKAAKGLVEIYERITDEGIQTVVDGKERLVLRDKPFLGYKNAVKLTHEPNCIPNRFEGWGVGHNTMGTGKLYYQLRNQSIESVKLTNNPMFLAKKGLNIDPRQLVAKPGGVAFVDDNGEPLSNNIQVIQFPDTKQGMVNLLDRLEEDHKRESGANDLVQGAASNKTLGQDQIASSYSSQRFELIQRRFKEALSDVARMIIKMELDNLQSVDAPILRIFPEEMRQAIFELLINEKDNIKFNVRVKGDTNIAKNRDVQIKQIIEAYNLFGVSLPPENQMAWARKILELRGVDGIDELVPDPKQMQAQIQAQQIQQPIDPNMVPQGMGVQQPTA